MQKELVELLQKGDHNAFEEVYIQWHKKVYYYFLKKTNESEQAKDLTQMTFVNFWKYRASITAEYTIEVLLFNKVKFVYIDWLRKNANERKLASEHEADLHYDNSLSSPDTSFELSQSILTAINSLPEMRKKVFKLKHLDGYSYKEIASSLGISPKTVDNHLLQATRQMKRIMSSFFTLIILLLQ
ncbi:RNA polymerase sigma factor [Desertivirga brevis]|uniref:RNA polymerase sigma factor n=1 Tax=Desertivirga brevis TaxID=2810310 RepID=UPI001A964609|nr:sigma-70 family RNA polymerase sigma factor [Pedobacter sp. SYSU D00873]